jgi:hypothetical protein
VVETIEDMQRVLRTLHDGFVFGEFVIDKDDSPVDLIRGGHAFAGLWGA